MKCDLEFFESLKDIFSKKDANEILDDMRQRAKAKVANGSSLEDALNQAANDVAKDYQEAVKQQTYRQYINVMRYDAAKKFINSFKNPVDGLAVLMGGKPIKGKVGVRDDVAAAQVNRKAQLAGLFIEELNKREAFEAYHNPANHADVWREAYNPGGTKNEGARHIVEAMQTAYSHGRKLLNKNGAAIGELKEYLGRQIHNIEKMTWAGDDWLSTKKIVLNMMKSGLNAEQRAKQLYDMAYTKWRDHILPKLDAARTFEGAEPEEFLSNVYSNIVKGKYNPTHFEGDFDFQGPANRAKKVSRERVLHFKDGDAAYEYNTRYGAETLPATIDRTLRNMGDNIGIMEKLGTNPTAMFDRLAREAEQYAKDNHLKTRKLRFARNILKEVDGSLRTPIDNVFAKISLGIRIDEQLSKLGGITLSSSPDIALRAASMRNNGVGWLESEVKSLGLFLSKTDKEDKQFADLIGVTASAYTHDFALDIASGNSPVGFLSKSMQKFYKLTGIEWFDKKNRTQATAFWGRYLYQNKDLHFDNLNPKLRDVLQENSIDAKLWDLYRKPEHISSFGGKKFINPGDARYFSKESIADYLVKDIKDLTVREVEDVRDVAEFRLRNYLLNNTADISVSPGAAERAIVNQGYDPNSVAGAGLRMLTQFKSFTVAFTRRAAGRYFYSGVNTSDVMALTQLIASTTFYGYLAGASKDILKGRKPKDPRQYKTIIAAMTQGGGLGIYGDFLFGEYNRFGGGFLETAGGPAIGSISQFTRVMAQLRDQQGHPGVAAYQFGLGHLPFINLIYTRTALDYLFLYGIQENMSPGSLRRMENRLKDEYNQQLIYPPSHYAARY
jgi:hypothetical protein